jgi:tetratricopeptide (TPR) repeat protein
MSAFGIWMIVSMDEPVPDPARPTPVTLDDAQECFNRATAKQSQGDLRGALEELDRAIGLKPDFVEAYYNRAMIHANLGDHDGAIADYGRFIERRSDYPEAYANRGTAYYALGRFAEAAEDFGAALKVAPPDWPYRAATEQALQEAWLRAQED